MPIVKPLDNAMFPEVYATFLRDDDPHLCEADWRRLFSSRDAAPDCPPGYVLLDGDRIVGVLGTCFSRRRIDGRQHAFCNLHTWIVHEKHRGSSLFLMRPVLANRGLTITDFSPTPHVCEVSQRLGFQRLDARLRLFPLAGRRRAATCSVIESRPEILDRLDDAERQLAADHDLPHMGVLLIEMGDRRCLMLYSRVDRWRLPYCYIHYISHQSRDALAAVRRVLAARTGARFAAIDARFTAGVRLSRSVTLPVASRQLVRWSQAPPSHVDTLYSEVSLLNLTTLPDLRTAAHELTRKLHRRH
ncbi:MAG: hypothetical protein KY475_17410 [Planctomycetes bacterium]|nr:hypothetical protein [Planctomycetota bacterium]